MSKLRGVRRPRKKLRVLVLMHTDLVPPENSADLPSDEFHAIKTEVHVIEALRELGHEVRNLGVDDSLKPIRSTIQHWKPDIVFNLLEEFQGEALFDVHVVAFLELLRAPYTGNGPRGLMLARDKALSKKLATYHRIRTPRFIVCRRGRKARRPAWLGFPIIVKSALEEGSMGISKASLVNDDESLARRVTFVHEQVETDALLEQFISGRELYVGVVGNDRLTALPARELIVGDLQPGEELIATAKLKHDVDYQKRREVVLTSPRLGDDLRTQLVRTSKRLCRVLQLRGYARIDYRLSTDDRLYFLEANPNPDIARGEEMATAAERAGISYPDLIQRILNLGLRR